MSRVLPRLLRSINGRSTTSILGSGPPVSMTTHGARTDSAYLAIESIGLGRLKPSRFVLWLDDQARFEP